MGVYIANMEKPKSCYNHCFEDFIANKEIGCPLKDYTESHQYKNAIHPNCPLIEINTDDPELSAFFEHFHYWQTYKKVVKYMAEVYGERRSNDLDGVPNDEG